MAKNKSSSKIEIATLIITLTVCVFSGVSVTISYFAWTTANAAYEATKPFQEPILDIEDTLIEYNFSNYEETGKIHFNMDFNLTNRGKGIAENVKIFFYGSDFENPEVFFEIGNSSYANPVYPNAEIENSIEFKLESDLNNKIVAGHPWAFVIRLEYKDHVSGKSLNRTCWGKTYKDSTRLIYLTIEEKNMFLPYYLSASQN